MTSAFMCEFFRSGKWVAVNRDVMALSKNINIADNAKNIISSTFIWIFLPQWLWATSICHSLSLFTIHLFFFCCFAHRSKPFHALHSFLAWLIQHFIYSIVNIHILQLLPSIHSFFYFFYCICFMESSTFSHACVFKKKHCFLLYKKHQTS